MDWLEIRAKELADFCLNDDSEGPYSFSIKLTPPAGLDYDLCVWPSDAYACGDLNQESGSAGACEELGIFEGGDSPETYTYPPEGQVWDGTCGGNDDKTFYVKIINYFASEEDCAPYTLEIEMTEL